MTNQTISVETCRKKNSIYSPGRKRKRISPRQAARLTARSIEKIAKKHIASVNKHGKIFPVSKEECKTWLENSQD